MIGLCSDVKSVFQISHITSSLATARAARLLNHCRTSLPHTFQLLAYSMSSSQSSALSSTLFRALNQSMLQNQMVEFSRYAQLASIALDGSPTCRSVNIRGLSEVQRGTVNRGVLRFSTDARSSKVVEFFTAARNAKDGHALAELCWFFPVTREQYRLKCHVELIFTEGAAVPASNVAASSATPAASPAAHSIVRSSPADQATHLSFWREHAEGSRALFEIAHPGTVKKRAEQGDLDKYEAQPLSENVPSNNFVTVLLLPFRCDYLKLPRPSDDTRGQITRVQHHESLTQPNRQQMRWLHTMDAETGAWKAVELNP
jgi:hypothetical protein